MSTVGNLHDGSRTRVAIYVRISTDEAHQPYSLEAQETRLRSYIASQDGWEPVNVFTDQASGATLDRPGLKQLTRGAHAGRFDLVLVYRVDRCSRSVRGLAQIVEELDKAQVAFRSATEPFDTATPAGRMMMQMLAVFAEFERATIIDRVIAGMERKAARGEWTSGSRPFGYTVDGDTGHLVINENEAPLVPVIYNLYLRDRLGTRAIAMRLNDQGHRTRKGKPWSSSSIATVLRNRAYVGEVYFRGAHHPAPHPPLIDPAAFQAAQDLLTERGGDHSLRRSNSSDYLLSGLVVCTHCGKRFIGNAAQGNKYRYRYYTCFTHQRYGKTACPSQRLPADELDTAVLDALLVTYHQDSLLDDAITAAHARVHSAKSQQHAELTAVESELAQANTAVDRYLTAFETGSLPESTCFERVRTHGQRIEELRRRRDELTEALEDQPAPPSADHLAAIREHIAAIVRHGALPARKALLRALVHEVTVQARDDILPVFRVPADAEHAKVREQTGLVGPAGLEPATKRL